LSAVVVLYLAAFLAAEPAWAAPTITNIDRQVSVNAQESGQGADSDSALSTSLAPPSLGPLNATSGRASANAGHSISIFGVGDTTTFSFSGGADAFLNPLESVPVTGTADSLTRMVIDFVLDGPHEVTNFMATAVSGISLGGSTSLDIDLTGPTGTLLPFDTFPQTIPAGLYTLQSTLTAEATADNAVDPVFGDVDLADGTLVLRTLAAPEPSALAIWSLVGVVAVGAACRRRRSASAT
jgi:hypothetical protein